MSRHAKPRSIFIFLFVSLSQLAFDTFRLAEPLLSECREEFPIFFKNRALTYAIFSWVPILQFPRGTVGSFSGEVPQINFHDRSYRDPPAPLTNCYLHKSWTKELSMDQVFTSYSVIWCLFFFSPSSSLCFHIYFSLLLDQLVRTSCGRWWIVGALTYWINYHRDFSSQPGTIDTTIL